MALDIQTVTEVPEARHLHSEYRIHLDASTEDDNCLPPFRLDVSADGGAGGSMVLYFDLETAQRLAQGFRVAVEEYNLATSNTASDDAAMSAEGK